MLLGCEKLNISSDGCKVVLEEDGSEIDDDELLQDLVGSTLMILQQGEDWSSESTQKIQAQASAPETKENGKHFAGDHRRASVVSLLVDYYDMTVCDFILCPMLLCSALDRQKLEHKSINSIGHF